jgi:hypothetical protein
MADQIGKRRAPALAPAPLKQATVAYLSMVTPAILGAVLDWPWWLATIFICPGLGLYVYFSRAAGRALGISSGLDGPFGRPSWAVITSVIVVAVLLGSRAVSPRYGVLVVVGGAICGELAGRAWWRLRYPNQRDGAS